MSGIEITRSEFTASDLRMAARKSRDARAAGRMLALALVLEDEPSSRHRFERRWRMIGRARPRPAGWTGRPFGSEDRESVQWTVSPMNGFTATARKAWRGCRTAAKACGFRVWCLHRWRTSLPGSRPGRTLRRTGWYAGDGRICSVGLPRRSGSICMSAQSASIWRRLGIAGCRFAVRRENSVPRCFLIRLAIPGPIPARRKRSKELPRGRTGGDPRGRARQAP